MKVVIKPWKDLPPADQERLKRRASAPEHEHEPVRLAWMNEAALDNLYVPIVHDGTRRLLLGIFGAGGPPKCIIPSWWIDSAYRGQGYSKRAVEKFADYLLVEKGVTGVGAISLQTGPHDDHHQKSGALARRFRSCFRRISIDSNCLTYVIDAMNSTEQPSGDLAEERIALLRIFLYLDDTLWVPKTAMDEAHAIRDVGRANEHIGFNSSLFGTWPTQNQSRVDQRADEFMMYHRKRNDCYVLAEAEDTFMTVLLTRDRQFIDRLSDKTNVRLCKPSEYWAALNMLPGAKPAKRPHDTNPLAAQTWWRWA